MTPGQILAFEPKSPDLSSRIGGELVAAFEDRHKRVIQIEIYGDSAYARHEGKQIGYVKTSGIRESDNFLFDLPAEITGWEVNEEYRRAGIATAMVRALVNELGSLAPAAQNTGIAGQNSLTEDGEYMTAYCQKLGLIYPHAVDTPD